MTFREPLTISFPKDYIVTDRSLTMTQTEIIQAAFRVWGRDFYQNTSLSGLAKELGVSKPALYRHFRNKQALADAMSARFYDDFAAFIRADYERAARSANVSDAVFILIGRVAEYYARNVYALIFSLINVYDRKQTVHSAWDCLKARGVDMGVFDHILKKEYAGDPLLMQMVFSTLSFHMAYFHKTSNSFINTPSEAAVRNIIAVISEIIARGFGYTIDRIDAPDYAALEIRLAGTVDHVEDNPLIKAVAGAVAEAGPWRASMDMVARRSGLSKSGLYGHFKNRQDMLRRLFMTEFARIIAFAKAGIRQSAVPEEQLYLGIFSIVVYLRSRPEILTALDWIRTRKLDLGAPETEPDTFRLFEDIDDGRLKRRGGGGRRRSADVPLDSVSDCQCADAAA
jgi:AcrR family transcriptional regulator